MEDTHSNKQCPDHLTAFRSMLPSSLRTKLLHAQQHLGQVRGVALPRFISCSSDVMPIRAVNYCAAPFVDKYRVVLGGEVKDGFSIEVVADDDGLLASRCLGYCGFVIARGIGNVARYGRSILGIVELKDGKIPIE